MNVKLKLSRRYLILEKSKWKIFKNYFQLELKKNVSILYPVNV